MSPANVARAIELYEAGNTTDDIGKVFGVTRAAIGKAMRKAGYPLRRRPGTRVLKLARMASANEHLAAEEVAKIPQRLIHEARALARTQENEEILSRVVHRDPCSYCGVRADVGCRHQRWAA